MKKIINLFLVTTLFTAFNVVAQNVKLKVTVVNTSGLPLAGVSVTAGNKTTNSSSNGLFTLQTNKDETLVLELDNFQTKYIVVSQIENNQITLNEIGIGFAEGSRIKLPFRETDKNNFTGTTSVISGKSINGLIDINLLNSLKGKASGLYISEKPGPHEMSEFDISVRGFNTMGNTAPLFLVDGIERPLEFVQNTDVESVTILKDAVSKSFFKGKAANGVILVTTKRGEKHKNVRTISIETGVSTPTFIAKPLGSSEYASLYNLARRNSGLSDLYSPSDLLAFDNPNLQYPSNDSYNLLLKDSKLLTKISANFGGGSENTQFNINANYIHDSGIENAGHSNSFDQYTFRSNLDFKISSIMDGYVNVYGFLTKNASNYTTGNDIFSRMSYQRPNEYTYVVTDASGEYPSFYGAGRYNYTSGNYQNLFAEMNDGGYKEDIRRVAQTDLGVKFNLNSILKGLSAKASISFDSFTYISSGQNNDFESYLPNWENNILVTTQNNPALDQTLITIGKQNTGISKLGSDGYSQYTATFQLDYKKVFSTSKLNMSLLVFTDRREYINNNIIPRSQSNSLFANYSIKDKWIADFNLGYLGSSRFSKGSQYDFFPAVGLGWVMSKENFLINSKNINYLKLKASYGTTPTDVNLDYFAYKTRYDYYGSGITKFGLNAEVNAQNNQFASYLNPSLDWEKSGELNVGLESVLFNNITFNLDFYNTNRTDIPIDQSQITNQVSGLYNNQINFASIKTNGFDTTLGYNMNVGNWKLYATINANYALSKYDKSSSWTNLPDGRNLNGKAVDAYFGLTSSGIIKNVTELTNTNQAFGDLNVGDLKYEDTNGDGIVNQNDVTEIGNSMPRLHYGTTISVAYKNVSLVISGYGAAKYDLYLNNSYFRPISDKAYFEPARNAFNPETGVGTSPSLTVGNSSNNNRLSDHWLVDGSYFKIKEIELSYSLPEYFVHKINLDNLKVYIKGNNLMTFTDIKDVDPEYVNAGFSSYPFMRTIAFGINLTF
jgi:TonB-linked SusC/RagA family outer membrane protein